MRCYECNRDKSNPTCERESNLRENSPAALDELLQEHNGRSINLQTLFVREDYQETLLMYAVDHCKPEIIAVLMYHSADPLQTCPQLSDLCAFEMNFSRNLHARNRPFFHFIATLLNHGLITESMGINHRDHLMGANVNAPLPDIDLDVESFLQENPSPPHWKTALMYACDRGYPFCVRYLLRICNADVNIQNDDGLDAMDFALLSFDRNARVAQGNETFHHERREMAIYNYSLLFMELHRAGPHWKLRNHCSTEALDFSQGALDAVINGI